MIVTATRWYALVAVVLLLAGCASSASPSRSPSPDPAANARYALDASKIGTTWTYTVSGSNGSHERKTLTLTAVSRQGNDVVLSIVRKLPGRADQTLRYVNHPDGSESIPWDTAFSAAGLTVTRKTGDIILPGADVLASEAVRTSKLTFTLSDGQHSEHVQYTAKTNGAGRQRVTVAAGTYTTQVVHVDITGATARERIEQSLTYYLAAGVGTVKLVGTVTETGAKAHGPVHSSEELQSMTSHQSG